jgi:hypothetical protein
MFANDKVPLAPDDLVNPAAIASVIYSVDTSQSPEKYAWRQRKHSSSRGEESSVGSSEQM